MIKYDKIMHEIQKAHISWYICRKRREKSIMFDEFGKEDDSWRPEIPMYRKVIKKAFSVFFVCFVFGLIALMSIRLIASKPPSSMKKMVYNEITENGYNTYGSDFKVQHILASESFNRDGRAEDSMFSVSMITYAPQIKQLQVTLRYNNRALKYLKNEYPEAGSGDGEIYTFALRDNNGVRYSAYSYTKAEKTGYTYRRLIFENVSLTDVSEMKLLVFYSGQESKENPRHTLYVYRYDFAKNDYDHGKPPSKKPSFFTYTGQHPEA